MLDAAKIAELKDKHGQELVAVDCADGTSLVFRKPPRQEYNRWFDTRREQPSQSGLSMAQACLVYPTYPEMLAAIDRQPAILCCGNGIVDAITELAGVPTAELAKPKKL